MRVCSQHIFVLRMPVLCRNDVPAEFITHHKMLPVRNGTLPIEEQVWRGVPVCKESNKSFSYVQNFIYNLLF